MENGWWEGGGAGTGSKWKGRETSLMNCSNLLTGKGWMFVAWIWMVDRAKSRYILGYNLQVESKEHVGKGNIMPVSLA